MTLGQKTCLRCVMDDSDPDIEFDERGFCNHCRRYEELAVQYLLPLEQRKRELDRLVSEIKSKGANREYDCLIGLSGGVDSSFTAFLVKELGLRPLAVHVDNGWDSELAVSNIEKFLKKLDIDLYTFVLDWKEFKSLQLSFLRASVPDIEIPTDHAIWAVMYDVATSKKIPYIISGFNFVTELIMPMKWAYGHYDWRYIRKVHHQFGEVPLRTFPHLGFIRWYLYYPFIRRTRLISILNLVSYNKLSAAALLQDKFGWRNYGGKHYESIYTRFIQGYILPVKFGIDKRKAHLSTLIMTGHMSREEALAELMIPPYEEGMLKEDIEYVLKKLDLTADEFQNILSLPPKSYIDYPTHIRIKTLMRRLHLYELGTRIGTYQR